MSPDGRKVVLSARGDLFLIDPGQQVHHERDPDPRRLRAIPSVESRRRELRLRFRRHGRGPDLRSPGGRLTGEPEQVSRMEAGRIGPLSWSPDGRRTRLPRSSGGLPYPRSRDGRSRNGFSSMLIRARCLSRPRPGRPTAAGWPTPSASPIGSARSGSIRWTRTAPSA
ncbi:MAG: hypothetical protein MZV64_13315 [Ignavibacteriales bacterium]|nr:hypothetical protein [Ignavibacteriales bacterium]